VIGTVVGYAKSAGRRIGVPLMRDEPADFRIFRIGLFGLDKLADVDGTVRGWNRCWSRWRSGECWVGRK